jgi:RNA polymerase sigma-70 factor (ECF subfamily)
MARRADEQEEEWSGLLRAAIAGDSRAYDRFLRAIAPVLRGIVRSRGRMLGEAVCEDVVQEVLLAVHLKRHTWDSRAPVRPWLFAIARYKVVDAFRARGAAVSLPIDDFAEVLPAPPQADPTLALDADRLIARLDPRSAEIVRSIGMRGEEIAATSRRLAMTEGALRVALHRALKRLAAMRARYLE